LGSIIVLATRKNQLILLKFFLPSLPLATLCSTFTSLFCEVLQEATSHPAASTHLLLSFSKEEKRNSLWIWKNPELGNEKNKGKQELRRYKLICLVYTTGEFTIMFFLAVKAHFHNENHVCMHFLHS